MIEFNTELIDAVWDESKELIVKNLDETGTFKGGNPDRPHYQKLEELGFLKVFTARKDGRLVGYALFSLFKYHPHFPDQNWAYQDVIFVDKAHRGIAGYRFMNWIDEQLHSLGIMNVSRSVHVKNDYSRVLEKMGYQKLETVFLRRFN